MPVTKGTRNSLVTWVTGKQFKECLNYLLKELIGDKKNLTELIL
jgi:hypothetical protein